MRTVTRVLLITVVFLAACCCLSFLPVIPVSKGAVVPPTLRHYSLGFASIQDLVGIFALMRVGVSYQMRWYTLAGIAGLFVVSCLITALVAFLVIRLRPERWLILLVFLLVGCGPLTGLAPTVAPTLHPPTLPTGTPFPAATPTLARSPTARPTLRPTWTVTSTRRPTSTRWPTATSVPTLPPIAIGPFQPFSIQGQPPGKIVDLRAAPDGTLWIVTDQNVSSLNGGKWITHPVTKGVLVGFDRAGRAWLVSDKGDTISAWNGVTWTVYGAEAGWAKAQPDSGDRFGENVVTDKQGWVWLTTSTDMRAFDGRRWTLYSAEQVGFTRTQEMINAGFEDYWLTDVIADSEGGVWVADCAWMGAGPKGHGARWLTGGKWQGQDSRVVASGCIYDLEVDSAGRIWAGVNGNVWRYTPGQGWKEFPHPPVDPAGKLRWGYLFALDLDPAGNLWVTLLRCGGASCDTGQFALFRIVGDAWTLVLDLPGFLPGDLAFDTVGNAWLCTGEGLYYITPKTMNRVAEDQITSCRVETDAAGRVWLAVPGQSTLWVQDKK